MKRSAAVRFGAIALLAFVLLGVVSGLALTSRGQDEMTLSDHAFHEGDLRASIFHAKKSALAFVPGARHVDEAYARLEAIGRGAEARGDEELARIAWDALRVSVEQTEYPGRPQPAAYHRALKSLERLQQARQHDATQR